MYVLMYVCMKTEECDEIYEWRMRWKDPTMRQGTILLSSWASMFHTYIKITTSFVSQYIPIGPHETEQLLWLPLKLAEER